ncbi:hypothetical protein C3R30_21225, partial [Mycobacterium tuberculosis]
GPDFGPARPVGLLVLVLLVLAPLFLVRSLPPPLPPVPPSFARAPPALAPAAAAGPARAGPARPPGPPPAS